MSLTLDDLRERGMAHPVRVIHSICGAIVFYHDGTPRGKAGIVNPTKVILPNGIAPREGDPIICMGCGYEVRKNQLEWVMDDA
jgi:hypothetical protein